MQKQSNVNFSIINYYAGPNDNTGLKVLVQNNYTFGTSILNYGEDMVVCHNGDNTTNYGHNVLLYGSDNSTINQGYHVEIQNQNASENIGGFFDVTQAGSTRTEGIYASIPAATCTTGCSQFAGHFNGPILVKSVLIPSDSTLKKNINDIVNPSTLLSSLSPKSYEYDTSAIPQLNLAQGVRYGLLAQDLMQSFPQLVSNAIQPATYDTAGNSIHPAKEFQAINYTEFIPILIAGYKDLQSQTDSLRQIILSCCGIAPRPDNHSMLNGQRGETVELKDITTIILNQNVPNPFADETDIKYTLPSNVQSAKILIYDKTGNVLKTVELHDRGEGTLHIYAQDLSSGLYNYSLLVDGKVIETKTMVKSK